MKRVGLIILIPYIMKTRFFKFVLPVFALFMAVSFAFAAESKSVAKTAYYFHPDLGWQTTMVDDNCNVEGTVPCLFLGIQTYSQPSTGSIAFRKNI